MIFDNASTCLLAAEEIRKIFELDTLKEALESKNISWSFIPKRASMVRQVLGAYHWINKAGSEENSWMSIYPAVSA